jgi:subtilisin family serine protease
MKNICVTVKILGLMMMISLFVPSISAFAEDPSIHATPFNSKHPFMAGEVIVKFKNAKPYYASQSYSNGISTSMAAPMKIEKLNKKGSKKNKAGSFSVSAAGDSVDEAGIYKITMPGRQDVYNMVDEIKRDPDVEYAEPNYLYQVSAMPNDPSYAMQWGMYRVGASSAWDVTQGSSNVVVAVVDTGVDYTHQDLANNIWTNTKEIPGNGIDDDGNGYIDDVRGWDFVTVPSDWVAAGEDPGPQDNDPMDFLGHGTHVSGIIAGKTNNSLGIAGMSWNSKIMPLRAGYMCIDGGGYLELADIAEAIHYAADNGANVINMSFGCPYDSTCLREAIDYAHAKGLVLVASAGNVDSYDAGKPFYPAAYAPVIAVSSVDNQDHISIWGLFAFSNFGEFVDICAPGTNILSTLPGNGYGYASGTSMAAPFVSGLAALIKSKHPDWNSDQIEARIKSTSDDIYATNPQEFLKGKLGSGRINAKRALGNLSLAITYPTPDTLISGAVAIQGSASIEDFSAYKVEYSSQDSPDTWKTIVMSSDKPVEEGTLAIWSAEVPDGRYNLKVTVQNLSGEVYQYVSNVGMGVNGDIKLAQKPQVGPSPYDPDKGDLLFYYKLLNAADVDIYVYDLSGTLVYRKGLNYDASASGSGGSAGENRVYWDGVNGFGETLSNGAYIYMIVAKDSGDRKIIGRGKFAVVRS